LEHAPGSIWNPGGGFIEAKNKPSSFEGTKGAKGMKDNGKKKGRGRGKGLKGMT